MTRLVVDAIKMVMDFELKCPFKKGLKYHIRPIPVKLFFGINPLVKLNEQIIADILITEGVETKPIMSLILYTKKIEIDD